MFKSQHVFLRQPASRPVLPAPPSPELAKARQPLASASQPSALHPSPLQSRAPQAQASASRRDAGRAWAEVSTSSSSYRDSSPANESEVLTVAYDVTFPDDLTGSNLKIGSRCSFSFNTISSGEELRASRMALYVARAMYNRSRLYVLQETLMHAEALFPNLTMGDENLFNIFENIRLSQLVMQEVRNSTGPREGLPMNPDQARNFISQLVHELTPDQVVRVASALKTHQQRLVASQSVSGSVFAQRRAAATAGGGEEEEAVPQMSTASLINEGSASASESGEFGALSSLGALASLPEETFEKAKKDPLAGLNRMVRKNKDKWEVIQWLIEYGQLNGAVQKGLNDLCRAGAIDVNCRPFLDFSWGTAEDSLSSAAASVASTWSASYSETDDVSDSLSGSMDDEGASASPAPPPELSIGPVLYKEAKWLGNVVASVRGSRGALKTLMERAKTETLRWPPNILDAPVQSLEEEMTGSIMTRLFNTAIFFRGMETLSMTLVNRQAPQLTAGNGQARAAGEAGMPPGRVLARSLFIEGSGVEDFERLMMPIREYIAPSFEYDFGRRGELWIPSVSDRPDMALRRLTPGTTVMGSTIPSMPGRPHVMILSVPPTDPKDFPDSQAAAPAAEGPGQATASSRGGAGDAGDAAAASPSPSGGDSALLEDQYVVRIRDRSDPARPLEYGAYPLTDAQMEAAARLLDRALVYPPLVDYLPAVAMMARPVPIRPPFPGRDVVQQLLRLTPLWVAWAGLGGLFLVSRPQALDAVLRPGHVAAAHVSDMARSSVQGVKKNLSARAMERGGTVATALRPRPGADPYQPLPVLFGFHQHFGWVPELLDVSPQSDRYWMLREATLEVVNTSLSDKQRQEISQRVEAAVGPMYLGMEPQGGKGGQQHARPHSFWVTLSEDGSRLLGVRPTLETSPRDWSGSRLTGLLLGEPSRGRIDEYLQKTAPVNERLAEAKARALRRETQPGLFRWVYETQPGLREYLDAVMDLGAGAEAARAGRMGRGLPLPRVAREAPGVGLVREGADSARVVFAQVTVHADAAVEPVSGQPRPSTVTVVIPGARLAGMEAGSPGAKPDAKTRPAGGSQPAERSAGGGGEGGKSSPAKA